MVCSVVYRSNFWRISQGADFFAHQIKSTMARHHADLRFSGLAVGRRDLLLDTFLFDTVCRHGSQPAE